MDDYVEVTSESWFKRMGSSIKGILFGFILFVGAFPLLWWNEGRSVERYNSLKEGQGLVIAIAADAIDPANDGKLVHTQGLASTQETLKDDVFAVSAPAIKLQRLVSMYQWEESENSKTTEKVDGSKTTTKTYSYDKGWSDKEINSDSFKQKAGHNNPAMPTKNQTFQARDVSLGAFKLNSNQIGRLSGEHDLSLQGVSAPTQLAGKKLSATGTSFYLGDNPADPQIGDLKINFKVLEPSEVSIVAEQQGNSFIAYSTKAGSDIDLLAMGLKDPDTLFAEAQRENTLITWAFRIGGFLLMWLGLSMIFKPLSVLAAVVPFLGHLIAMGTGIFAFLLSLPFTMITIAIAWIAYRPLLAGILFMIAVVAIIAMKFMPRQNYKPAPAS